MVSGFRSIIMKIVKHEMQYMISGPVRGDTFAMKIVKDGFQVRKIEREEIPGAIAPIYLLGLPGDLDKFQEKVK